MKGGGGKKETHFEIEQSKRKEEHYEKEMGLWDFVYHHSYFIFFGFGLESSS
jgi:hypothetical protein